jgi:DNA-binding NtrC family response regulator
MATRNSPDRSTVLITLTDVEPAVRLNALVEKAGIETEMLSPMDDAGAALQRARPAVVVVTGAPADPHNLHLLRGALWDGARVIGLSDVSDPRVEVELRQLGYSEVIAKPVEPNDLADAVRRNLERQRLSSLTGLIGDSDAIREVFVKVEQMAPVSSTVLIEGESGTGKELVARGLHRLGPRRARPFIAVNVGALPETLLESELFGHEKGAFTGAAERRIGRFELADGGTIFLDEIGEIPPSTQVKLLRVLEEREVTRVGGTQSIPVDVRVVTATNASLRELVERSVFRSDLYYRLNVLRIYLPPLRERREDIPLLVRQFVREFSTAHDRPFRGISPEALQLLVEYPWPGNVRELRNLVESMVVLAPGREIGAEDIPRQIRDGGAARRLPVPVGAVVRGQEAVLGREMEFVVRSLVELKLQVEELRQRLDAAGPSGPPVLRESAGWLGELRPAPGFPGVVGGIEARDVGPAPNVFSVAPGMTMAEIERAAIESALRETRGNRRKAAELLAIGERTLYRKLREYQLPEEEMVP